MPFPAYLYRELSRLDEINESRRRLAGAEWQDCDLVFPSPRGTPQSEPGMLNCRFRPFPNRAGLPQHFTLYSLRYTYATLQLLAGERDKVVSNLTGHTNVNFTKDVYAKVLPVMQEEASDGFESLFFGAARTTLAQ